MTPERLKAIGHLYVTAQRRFSTLDVDWVVQVDPDLGWPRVRLRVVDRRGQPRRTWTFELNLLGAEDELVCRHLIDRRVRELCDMIKFPQAVI